MAEEKAYSRRISRDTLEKTRRGIHNYIIVGKRYRNPKYTALQLSEDIGVNTRYLSAAIQKHYGCNFATLVNKLRIEDAKEMLSATECTLTMEDLSYSAGFSTRQSFYNAFSKYVGMPPSEYRERVLRLRTQDDDAFEILDFWIFLANRLAITNTRALCQLMTALWHVSAELSQVAKCGRRQSTDAKPRAESTDAKPRAESSLLGLCRVQLIFNEVNREGGRRSQLAWAMPIPESHGELEYHVQIVRSSYSLSISCISWVRLTTSVHISIHPR